MVGALVMREMPHSAKLIIDSGQWPLNAIDSHGTSGWLRSRI